MNLVLKKRFFFYRILSFDCTPAAPHLASYPGRWRGGEKRPGTFCTRMRRIPHQNMGLHERPFIICTPRRNMEPHGIDVLGREDIFTLAVTDDKRSFTEPHVLVGCSAHARAKGTRPLFPSPPAAWVRGYASLYCRYVCIVYIYTIMTIILFWKKPSSTTCTCHEMIRSGSISVNQAGLML